MWIGKKMLGLLRMTFRKLTRLALLRQIPNECFSDSYRKDVGPQKFLWFCFYSLNMCVYTMNARECSSFTLFLSQRLNVHVFSSSVNQRLKNWGLLPRCNQHPCSPVKDERHRATEAEVKEASMSGIIGVSGASSFSDVILCKHCLLQDARSAEQLRLLFSFSQ